MSGYGFRRDVLNGKLNIEVNGVKKIGLATGEALPRGALTRVDIDAQNAAPTVAQIKSGLIVHTSVTGAGTLTVPTGALIDAGFVGLAVGDTVAFYYLNDGTQLVTLTGDTGTTATAAQTIATLQGRTIIFLKTAADTFIVFGV